MHRSTALSMMAVLFLLVLMGFALAQSGNPIVWKSQEARLCNPCLLTTEDRSTTVAWKFTTNNGESSGVSPLEGKRRSFTFTGPGGRQFQTELPTNADSIVVEVVGMTGMRTNISVRFTRQQATAQ